MTEAKIGLERYHLVPVPDVSMHSTWFSKLQAYVPSFEAVYSNEPLTRRLVMEAGCRVKNIPLFRREIYWATEVRKRMLAGGDWAELVPRSVADYIESNGLVQRIVELAQDDAASRD